MSSPVRLIRSPSIADAAYAHSATAPAGSQFLYLAGSCPLDAEGDVVGPGNVVLQAAQCLDNMQAVLRDSGCDITDVISTRVLVATPQRDDLVAAWDVVARRFGTHDVPSTLLGVTVLGYPDQLVEIEAIAVRPSTLT